MKLLSSGTQYVFGLDASGLPCLNHSLWGEGETGSLDYFHSDAPDAIDSPFDTSPEVLIRNCVIIEVFTISFYGLCPYLVHVCVIITSLASDYTTVLLT